MYKARCQTYHWFNFGVYHESKNIGQFADGTLFEKRYLEFYCDPQARVSKDAVRQSLSAIAKLQETLAPCGVDVMFVMAVDKIQMTEKPFPWLTEKLFRKHRTEFQSEYEHLLSDYYIKSLDTHALLTNMMPHYAETMFPYAGTHWNALGASLVVEEILTRLNLHSMKPYRLNHFIGVEECPRPHYADDDLGKLLNLFFNPYLKRNKRFLPRYERKSFAPNDGSVIVFGDSFSCEITFSLRRAHEFDNRLVLNCNKRLPTDKEYATILPNLRLVIFVYQTPNMLELDNRFGSQIKKFCTKVQSSY